MFHVEHLTKGNVMKYLGPIVVTIVLIRMLGALAQAEASFGRETAELSVPIQYTAPSEGRYVHGEHCIDGRVF